MQFRLDPDWRKGLFVDGRVELVRLGAGSLDAPSTVPTEGERTPRALDLSATRLQFPDPSPLDPWAELPVVEVLGGAFYEDNGYDYNFGSRRAARVGPAVSVLRRYEQPEALERWALWGHDLPIRDGAPVVPDGWPQRASAVTVAPDVLAAYRDRDAIAVEGRVLDVHLTVDAGWMAAVLPSELAAPAEPVVRVLAIEASKSDVSTVPFTEAWLLAACELTDGPGWYALGHIVGEGGDVLYGREVFGYPSKAGEPVLADGRLVVDRVGRRVAEVSIGQLASPVEVSESMDVVGLQADPFAPGVTIAGRVVAQRWEVTGSVATTDVADASALFPAEPGAAAVGLPDPWFELAGAQMLSARAGTVRVARLPGRVVASVADVWPAYRERADGTWSGKRIVEPAAPTFRLR